MESSFPLQGYYQSFKLFWEDYLPTTEFKITGPVGTIFWILSGIWQGNIAILALFIHLGPILAHYIRNRPFGIDFDYAPTRSKSGEPDLISANQEQAIVRNGSGRIHARVSLVRSISSFAIRFDSDGYTTVELRDIPEPEHKYDRDENVLWTDNVSSQSFQLVIDVFSKRDHGADRGYVEVIDEQGESTLAQVELIRV